MNKKIISIIIICLILLVGIPYTTIAEVDDMSLTQEVAFSKKIKKTEHNNKPSKSFDMYLDCLAWISPYSKNEEISLICLNIEIDYIGDFDNTQDYNFITKVYAIYPDGREILVKTSNDYFGTFFMPYLGWMFSRNIDEKPVSVRVQFETNHPEENIENNQKTVTVSSGITVHGYSYLKDRSGNLNPSYTYVNIKAEESHFFINYFEGKAHPDWDGYYYVYAPLISGYTYPIKGRVHGTSKSITKHIENAEENQVYSLDFTFSEKNKPIRQNYFNIFNRFKDKHPFFSFLLQRLLNLK